MSRIPTSLKWLVDKRARLVKRIGKVQQEADQARGTASSLDRACEALCHDLEALDWVLSLHEIRVHPETIRPLRTNVAGALFPPQLRHPQHSVVSETRERPVVLDH